MLKAVQGTYEHAKEATIGKASETAEKTGETKDSTMEKAREGKDKAAEKAGEVKDSMAGKTGESTRTLRWRRRGKGRTLRRRRWGSIRSPRRRKRGRERMPQRGRSASTRTQLPVRPGGLLITSLERKKTRSTSMKRGPRKSKMRREERQKRPRMSRLTVRGAHFEFILFLICDYKALSTSDHGKVNRGSEGKGRIFSTIKEKFTGPGEATVMEREERHGKDGGVHEVASKLKESDQMTGQTFNDVGKME
ncbi:hypothetical protein QJS04_geneDACA020094 [Acorus gramineus]|uniref:Uncharacterized protein n=1 Tax=Acorus gramineus TaxID=55184 RepID=A0AAV9A5W6_ACOGR|nr:hypothetical protein QJS04_geneDACA020094 [Acorus gramineus]